jgi:hypothetical protein
MNPNWNRWIKASVFNHLVTELGTEDHIYIEASPRKTSEQPRWFELRFDGPEWFSRRLNQWFMTIEVNVLVSVKSDLKQLYTIDNLTGRAVVAFSKTIPVLKLGSESGDDQSHVTCLRLTSTKRDGIQVSNFGIVQTASQLEQSTVEAHFTGDFINGSV